MVHRNIALVLIAGLNLFADGAGAQHPDVEITFHHGMLVTDPRIGEGAFGEAPNPPNVADEPGFEVEHGNFHPGQPLGFDAVPVLGRHLGYWDGTGSVAFMASPVPLTIQHPVSGASILLTSTTNRSTLPGFLIGVADSRGGLHQDLEFLLADSTPPAGVYLFGMEMTSEGFASTSLPLYMVLASGVSEPVHEAAMHWVHDHLVVPEPMSYGLGIAGCLLYFRSGRGRSPERIPRRTRG